MHELSGIRKIINPNLVRYVLKIRAVAIAKNSVPEPM
jgi:hypothetical protein